MMLHGAKHIGKYMVLHAAKHIGKYMKLTGAKSHRKVYGVAWCQT